MPNPATPIDDSDLPHPLKPHPLSSRKLAKFQQCSIKNFIDTGLHFLDDAMPLTTADFQGRRDRLAMALAADGFDAFVAEPGFTFKYYVNVSQPEWEAWEVRSKFPYVAFVWSKTFKGSFCIFLSAPNVYVCCGS